MDTIRRNTSGQNVVSYLVIASESGEIIILDAQSCSVLQHVSNSKCNLILEFNESECHLNNFISIGSNHINYSNTEFDISKWPI